jgi:hypothetical protein
LSTAPKITKIATTLTETPARLPQMPALGDGQRAEKTRQRRAGMAEFAGDVLAEKAVEQRQQRHQRQRPADRPPRRLQHHGEQHDGDRRPASRALQKAVLVASASVVPGDPEAGRHPERAEDQCPLAR